MSADRRPILVLDAYGVLYMPGDDVEGQLLPFIAEKGGPPDREHTKTMYREASLGRINTAAFWASVGLDARLEDEYLARIRLSEDVPDFLLAAQDAFAAIGCLSNDVSDWSRKLRERHKLIAAVSTWIISGDVGLRKPDLKIYEHMLRILGVVADQVVFVDDRVANLDTAHALGIRTIWMNPAGMGADSCHPVAKRLDEVLRLAKERR